MTKSLSSQVRSLPRQDQLEQALYLLDEISGHPDAAAVWLKATYGLTKTEGQLFCALNARYPMGMTKEALFACLNNEQIDIKIVDVYVCKIRKKVSGLIETLWGHGYRMTKQIDIPLSHVDVFRPKQGTPWTAQDDEDLMMMSASGSHISVMVDEMQRSERSCTERLWKLRK